MTTIRLTREFVAKAIAKEPYLEAGSFLDYRGDMADRPQPECPACAVGTVMRRALSRKTPAENVVSAAGWAVGSVWDIPLRGEGGCLGSESISQYAARVYRRAKIYVRRSPMATLSYLFESLSFMSRQVDAEDVRGHVVSFVLEFFPDEILVDINGFEPAADVRAVTLR